MLLFSIHNFVLHNFVVCCLGSMPGINRACRKGYWRVGGFNAFHIVEKFQPRV